MAKKKSATAPKKSKKAKQTDLPGMEERRIPDLHSAAERYAEVRDERMELTKAEVEQKQRLIELMHKHEKQEYRFDDVEIKLVVEKEKVKVKIRGKEATED